jgi:hypothetical protein
MMRSMLHALCAEFSEEIPGLNAAEKMGVYEFREELFVTSFTYPERTYHCLQRVAQQWIEDHMTNKVEATNLQLRVVQLLQLDQAFAPHTGATREVTAHFNFDADEVMDTLEGMDLPPAALFAEQATEIRIHIPGGVGDIIKDPDGGVWIHAERSTSKDEHAAKLQPVTVQALAMPA